MGLGKSLQSVAFTYMFLMHKKGKNALVVCPKSVLSNWNNEFSTWIRRAHLKYTSLYLIAASKSQKERLEMIKTWSKNGGVAFINYELLAKLVSEADKEKASPLLIAARDGIINTDLLIVDEGHRVKNPQVSNLYYVTKHHQYF